MAKERKIKRGLTNRIHRVTINSMNEDNELESIDPHIKAVYREQPNLTLQEVIRMNKQKFEKAFPGIVFGERHTIFDIYIRKEQQGFSEEKYREVVTEEARKMREKLRRRIYGDHDSTS